MQQAAAAWAQASERARGPQNDDAAYNARMAALYREVVLKEKPVVGRTDLFRWGL